MKSTHASLAVLAAAMVILLGASPAYSQRPPIVPPPCADSDTKTYLLFPFVTNQAGFDTGVSIANTAADPFGTVGAAGTCTFTFHGSNAPANITIPSLAQGGMYVNVASTFAPGFQGYMIASCNFPYAHGFSFISDLGALKLAMGYLPTNICSPRVPPQ